MPTYGSDQDIAASAASTARLTAENRFQLSSSLTYRDQDWVGVELLAGHTYRFNVVGNFDSMLELRGIGGAGILTSNDDFNGLNPQITYAIATTGTYYLNVLGYNGAGGNYTLSATDLTPLVATAPVTTAAVATAAVTPGLTSSPTIDVGDFAGIASTFFTESREAALLSTGNRLTTSSTIESRGRGVPVDYDWYRVSLVQGQSYEFRLVGVNGFDTYLHLNDASSQEIAANDDSDGTLNSRINYTATSSGTYYLVARAYNEMLTGSYNLSVLNTTATTATTAAATTAAATTAAATTAAADNIANSTLSTTRLAIGSSITSAIDTVADIDYVGVNLVAGNTYQFQMNRAAGSTLDSVLRLVNSSNEFITSNNDASDSTRDSLFTYTATSSGLYFLQALSNAVTTGQYSLIATLLPVAAPTDSVLDNVSTTNQLAVGSWFGSTVETNADHDWFRVNLVAGNQYRFNLDRVAGSSLNALLALRDANGNLISSNDNANGGLNSELTYTAQASGTYYLDAGSSGNATQGGYNLSATYIGDSIADNTTTTAALSVGGASALAIDSNADHDWVRINLQSGNLYRFNMNATSGALNTLLNLRDVNGNLISSNDNANSGLNSELTYTAQASGTYYLDAGSSGNATQGGYNLSATYIGDSIADNTATTAALSAGGTSALAIDSNADHDWVRINLQSGNLYRFNMNATSGALNTLLNLRDVNGNLISSNDNANGGLDSELTYTAQASGTYYLDAGSSGNATQGGYNLSATYIGDSIADNTTTTAALSVGGTSALAIDSNADHDWVRINLQSGNLYRFNMNATSGALNTLLNLRDVNGNLISSNDNANSGLNSELTYIAQTSGTYYLDAGSSGGATQGSYNLSAVLTTNASSLSTASAWIPSEIGNTASTAYQIGAGFGIHSSVSAGDHDWFSIQLNQGTRYRFNLDSESGVNLDTTLTLRGPVQGYDSSTLGIWSYSDDIAWNNTNSQIDFTPTISGTYYLDAASYYSSQSGDYHLRTAVLS